MLGRFQFFDPEIESGMPPGKNEHRSNQTSAGLEACCGRNTFFAAPTDTDRARHSFPADEIGCVPFWLVVSSGAHIYDARACYMSPNHIFTQTCFQNMTPRQLLGTIHSVIYMRSGLNENTFVGRTNKRSEQMGGSRIAPPKLVPSPTYRKN